MSTPALRFWRPALALYFAALAYLSGLTPPTVSTQAGSRQISGFTVSGRILEVWPSQGSERASV